MLANVQAKVVYGTSGEDMSTLEVDLLCDPATAVHSGHGLAEVMGPTSGEDMSTPGVLARS